MKTKHILALLTLPVLAACSEDLYTDKFDTSSIIVSKTPAYLTVYPESWTFGSYADQTNGTVQAGTNWTMSGIDSSWLTVSPESGNGSYDRNNYTFTTTDVLYQAAENTEPASRTCVITVSCHTDIDGLSELTQQQVFSQNGITPEFYADTDPIYNTRQPANGTTIELGYSTNVKPEHLSVRTDAAGCSGRFANNRLQLTLGENTGSSDRTVSFYVYMQETQQLQQINVAQRGYAYVYGTPDGSTSYTLPGEGGSSWITFRCNIGWKVVTNDCDWLTIAPASGDADFDNPTTVTFTAKPNDTGSTRSTYLYFENSAGVKMASAYIEQPPFTTEGSTSSFSALSARGESQTMTLTSPSAWKAVPTQDWVSVSPASGAANSTTEVTITVAPNKTSSSYRYGSVAFCAESSETALWTVSVSQKGATIDITTDITIPATDDGSHATINVISDVDWSVIGNAPSWCSIYPTSGSAGETAVRVSAAEDNPSLNSRSGTIELGLPGTTITDKCTVYQSGRQMVPGQSEINVDWREYPALPLEIEVPNEWVATASENWITVSPASGTGNATINVHIEANAGANARYGVISITSEGVTTNIPVNQGGRILNIETTAGEIGAMGGSTEFSVSSTVDYTTSISYGDNEPSGSVLPTDGWLTLEDISAEGVTAYRVTATANPSVNPRTAYVELISSDITGVKFTVTQRGRDIRLSALELSISGNGGTTEDIVVDADGEYSVTTEDTWFSIIKGTNNNFHLAVTPNTTGSNRTGTITVSLTDVADGESKSVTVTVKQNTSPIDFDLGDFGSDQDWN